MATHIIVLPVEGTPYISATIMGDEGKLKALQEAVGGYIEGCYNNRNLQIHPYFAAEGGRWEKARQILACSTVKVWANEEGMRDCSPNVGLLLHPSLHAGLGGCPHPLGNIALQVPDKVLKVLGFTTEMFAEEDEDEEADAEDVKVEGMD